MVYVDVQSLDGRDLWHTLKSYKNPCFFVNRPTEPIKWGFRRDVDISNLFFLLCFYNPKAYFRLIRNLEVVDAGSLIVIFFFFFLGGGGDNWYFCAILATTTMLMQWCLRYTGWPNKNGTVDTVDFSGLCSDQ